MLDLAFTSGNGRHPPQEYFVVVQSGIVRAFLPAWCICKLVSSSFVQRTVAYLLPGMSKCEVFPADSMSHLHNSLQIKPLAFFQYWILHCLVVS